MKSYSIAAVVMALAGTLAFSAAPAQGQAEPAAAAVAAPVIAKAVGAVKPKPKPPGTEWLKAEVIRADSNSMVVREQDNGMMIHTFTFSPELKDTMQATLDAGGYQYGDKVRILHAHGQTVALKIHGKPSKPN
ncbi:MAG TPA: hypothetical protein VMM16_09280 [Verrucomicrobiae bacterium]|nr:hypothetical protein [Verrucomicrobiae bacterium]